MNQSVVLLEEEERAVDVLRTLNRGRCLPDLNEHLKKAAEAAEVREGTATVTLTITIKQDPKADVMRVAGEVKSKLPKEKVRESLFFRTVEGYLSRKNPNQHEMFVE